MWAWSKDVSINMCARSSGGLWNKPRTRILAAPDDCYLLQMRGAWRRHCMQKKSGIDRYLLSERLSATLSQALWPTEAAARQMRAWMRMVRHSRARVPLIVGLIVLVLLGIVVPPLQALASVAQDYAQL